MTAVELIEREGTVRGWVRPGDLVYCDVCGERVYVWQLHHLDPVGRGGNPSRKPEDHQRVWIRADGRCHDLIHLLLDPVYDAGSWSEEDEAGWRADGIPHLTIEAARRGWAIARKRLSDAA